MKCKVTTAMQKRQARFRRMDRRWYDEVYSQDALGSGGYSEDSEKCIYYPVWQRILSTISANERIADFGCGVGQFAQLAIRCGKQYVYGVDFSRVAIERARELNPAHASLFHVGDLRLSESFAFEDYDVAVFLETLEHLEDDLSALSRILVRRRCVVTLPNFDYTSHYRFFDTVDACVSRYNDLLSVTRQDEVALRAPQEERVIKIWILDGVRR